MKRKFYALSVLLLATLPAFDANAGDWERVYYNDFGGNSATDPLIGPELSQDEIGNNYDYDETLIFGYLITKHCDNNFNWHNGGDHTFPEDKEVGYFLGFNPDNRDKELIAYRVKIDDLHKGTKLCFTTYVANLTKKDGSGFENPPILSLGVYEGPEPETLVSEQAYTKKAISSVEIDANATSLAWEKMTIVFTLDADMDCAYFIVGMDRPENNGWDFAIDDISIEMLQPEGSGLLSSNKADKPSFFEEGGFLHAQNVEGIFSYNISDLTGKTMLFGSTANGLIPVSTLQPGIYLVTIDVNGEKQVERVLLTGAK